MIDRPISRTPSNGLFSIFWTTGWPVVLKGKHPLRDGDDFANDDAGDGHDGKGVTSAETGKRSRVMRLEFLGQSFSSRRLHRPVNFDFAY